MIENIKLFFLITITLFFFATSSLLARAALVEEHIDAFSFTFFRLFFGTLTLLIVVYFRNKKFDFSINKNWTSSLFLFLYAICFSYAYIKLDAGVGALILFAIIQVVIILAAIIKKHKLSKLKLLGIVMAFVGLIYLLLPDEKLELPIFYVFLMTLSGIAWGFYTIIGKSSKNPLVDTADNFLKSLVFAFLFYLIFVQNLNISSYGLFLAFLSGGITSSIGYFMWYQILPKIEIITSGIIQLIVPIFAIILGIILLDEIFTIKLFIATSIILSGIFIAILSSKLKV